MARVNCRMLDTGDVFPLLKFDLVNNESITLPQDFGKGWNVLIFYRGHW